MALTVNSDSIRRADLAKAPGKLVRVGSFREDALLNAAVDGDIWEVWYNQTSDTLYVQVVHNDVPSIG